MSGKAFLRRRHLSRKLKLLDPEISAGEGGYPWQSHSKCKGERVLDVFMELPGGQRTCREAGGGGGGMTSEKHAGPDPLQGFVRILLCSK